MTVWFKADWHAYEAGAIANLPASVEAYLVASELAIDQANIPRFGTDNADNVTGLVGPNGIIPLARERNAMRTIVIGNSITGAGSSWTTYLSTSSIVHWAGMFGGAPFRFPLLAPAGTSAQGMDKRGIYSYAGATLAAINADLESKLITPCKTQGWVPECVVAILFENDISTGRTLAQIQADYARWSRLMDTNWPGIIKMVFTPLPSYGYEPAEVLVYAQVRDWLLTLDDGVSTLITRGDAYEDPANPAKPLAGHTDVSVHSNCTGGSILGRVLAATTARIASKWRWPFPMRYINPVLTGTGAATGTGITGTKATSVGLTGFAGATTVATAEQPGQLFSTSLALSAGPALANTLNVDSGSIATTDNQVSSFAEIEVVSGADKIHQLLFYPYVVDAAGGTNRNFLLHQTNETQPVLRNGDILTIVTPPEVATSGSISSVILYSKINGILAGGDFSFRIRKLGVLAINAAEVTSDKTALRALNTSYTNASQHKLLVTVSARCAVTAAAGVATLQGKSDAAATPITAVSGVVGIQNGLAGEDHAYQVSFVVLPGKNYRVDSVLVTGTATLGNWFESVL